MFGPKHLARNEGQASYWPFLVNLPWYINLHHQSFLQFRHFPVIIPCTLSGKLRYACQFLARLRRKHCLAYIEL